MNKFCIRCGISNKEEAIGAYGYCDDCLTIIANENIKKEIKKHKNED